MENRIKSLIKKLSRLGYNVKLRDNNYADPVCGMKISSDSFKTEYQSESYFFCSDHCKQQFGKDQKSYITK